MRKKYADMTEEQKQKHRECVKRYALKQKQILHNMVNSYFPPNTLNKILSIVNLIHMCLAFMFILYVAYSYIRHNI